MPRTRSSSRPRVARLGTRHPSGPRIEGRRGNPYARLLRAENALLAGCLCLGGAQLSGGSVTSGSTSAAVLVVALTVAFGNVVNDILDHNLDAIGKPWRPLPSNRISRATARRIATLLAICTVATALVLPMKLAVFAWCMLALAYVYSRLLKRLPLVGNITVATQTAATLPFGAAVAEGITAPVLAFSGVVAAGMLLFEVGKTASDRWHEQGSIRTIATVIRPHQLWLLMLGLEILCLGALASYGAMSGRKVIVPIVLGAPLVPIFLFHWRARARQFDLDDIEGALDRSKDLWVLSVLVLLVTA